MAENLIVYGVRCVWWDSIDKVGKKWGDLPCCPHCGSILYQMDEAEWNSRVKKYEAEGHPGYEGFTTWRRGKCFPSIEAAEEALHKEIQESEPT